MPIEFDPAWEYWEPDPEIAYAMSVPITNRDLVSEFYADVRRDGFTCGMRFGRGNPDYCQTHLAPDRTKIRERSRWTENKYCVQCKQSFTPKYRKQIYCRKKCSILGIPRDGSIRKLPDMVCKQCKKVFRPVTAIRKFCSKACVHACNGVPTNGNRPSDIDPDKFAKMFLSDASIAEMAKVFNVSTVTVKKWRRRLKLPARKNGRPKANT